LYDVLRRDLYLYFYLNLYLYIYLYLYCESYPICGVSSVDSKTAENKTDSSPPNYELNILLSRIFTSPAFLDVMAHTHGGHFCIVFLCVDLEVMSMFLKHLGSKSFCFCGEEEGGLGELDLSQIASRRC
jgi:hypothetical protein